MMLEHLQLSDVMVRRSSRLQAGNYYTMSDGHNSNPVATISYYETPVRSPRRSRTRTSRGDSLSPSFPKGLDHQQRQVRILMHDAASRRLTSFLKPESTTGAGLRSVITTASLHPQKASRLLLLFLVPLCFWAVVLLLTSFTPNNLLTDLILTKKLPVYSDPLQNSDIDLRAIYEKKYLEMQERTAAIEEATRFHLERRLAGLAKRMLGFHSAAASLSHRIRSLEAQDVKLTEAWRRLQQRPDGSRLGPELQRDVEALFRKLVEELGVRAHRGGCSECQRPPADRMADFALESQGASVVSSRCSQAYTAPSACLTLFGLPFWSLFRGPRTAIQGSPILAGKCWSFAGAEGTLAVSLSHPVKVTHVTVDHLPRYNSPTGDVKSAPRDFEVYGMKTEAGEGTFLGRFTYDRLGEPTQTFTLPSPPEEACDVVELRILSNWGQKEYTCLYRFRVHGQTDMS